jgi:hypothetical protein
MSKKPLRMVRVVSGKHQSAVAATSLPFAAAAGQLDSTVTVAAISRIRYSADRRNPGSSGEFVQQRFCVFEIGGVEAFPSRGGAGRGSRSLLGRHRNQLVIRLPSATSSPMSGSRLAPDVTFMAKDGG